MCLETRTGLVSHIPLYYRQLHDFSHWPHSRRPRGCQPATSGSVQAEAAPASLLAPGELERSKGHRCSMPLARRKPRGAGWRQSVWVCVSIPSLSCWGDSGQVQVHVANLHHTWVATGWHACTHIVSVIPCPEAL